MEEMLLRICVLVVSLLYINDHTVIQEQGEKPLVDIQQGEYLMHKEAVRFEQEMKQVTGKLPYSNQKVSKSYGRYTNAEGQDSWVQFMDDGKEENSHENQMSDGKDLDMLPQNLLVKDIQDDGVTLTHDNVEPELQHSNLNNEMKNVQKDGVLGHKKDGPHSNEEMKTLNEEQINGVQAKSSLNAVTDNTQKSFKLDQVEGTFQMPAQDSAPVMNNTEEISEGISREQSTEKPSNWYLWKFVSLISLIRLLKKIISKGSQRLAIIPTEDKTTPRSTSKLLRTFIPDHQVLSFFYDHHVRISPSTCSRVCDFVEVLVDELLEAARDASNEETSIQIGDFIGVGSLYESWATSKKMVCDLYVPITAPKSYKFDIELWKEKDASLWGLGKVKMVKVENISNGCPCMAGNSNDDILCLLHPQTDPKLVLNDAVGDPLCRDNTPYLSKKRVVRWFRTMITNAWREISHKYELELGFHNQTAPGALRVRFRSGQTVLFNITPVVQFKASQVYLLSYLSTNQDTSDTQWPISFAVYEKALLEYFNKTLADKSCHITCLQILSFLHKQQNDLSGKCGFMSYHLKSTLLHLLLCKPEEWKQKQLTCRLIEMLSFLEQKLQAKELNHALIGNSVIPNEIRLPQEFLTTKPTNIFLPMVLDEGYLKAARHLQELIKNTPILIQEYTLNTQKD